MLPIYQVNVTYVARRTSVSIGDIVRPAAKLAAGAD
jgi:hypothetical protein